jgi:superfamily I DNA and/or RNA helicase
MTLYEEAMKSGFVTRGTDDSFEITKEYKTTTDGRERLRIGTVDSFQGKEFDIIILSTVRSNELPPDNVTEKAARSAFGFLTLENRLNVAFSRAQKLLIVVGDGNMFNNELAKTYVEGLHEFYTNLSTNKEYGNRIQ